MATNFLPLHLPTIRARRGAGLAEAIAPARVRPSKAAMMSGTTVGLL